MRLVAGLIIAFAGVLTGPTAHALAPSRHRSISRTSCEDAGLPRDFCRRVGVEAYVTDANEWNDMAAHAQTPDGATACEGADAAAARVRDLGAELRAEIARVGAGGTGEAAAIALGRALHTVQDDCAHHGMPNPQHAWYSLDDFCHGTRTSPDIQPDAIECAREQTDLVFADVRAALDEAGVAAAALARDVCPEDPFNDNNNNDNPCDRVWLPLPWQACGFLGSADRWDGVDRRWNTDVVVPALRAAFAGGLLGTGDAIDVCGGDPLAIAAPAPDPDVDVSYGTPTCTKAHLVCFGKADETNELFDEPDDLALDGAGGCAVGGSGAGGGWLLALATLVALAARRRRARSDRSGS